MTSKFFFANLLTPKRHSLKICVDSDIMVQVAILVRAVGFGSKNSGRP
jgi:hypothetical protein